ncbi:MAG: zf-TFIIB domain-containing protein [Deltaproteobacteria bacterium]|nr:zf-TFIIB domain-containing protein [Deltaproteobacteria bacterium]
MKCPVCKTDSLIVKAVSEPLAMSCCEDCDGKWLSSTHYWSWLETLEGELPKKVYSDVHLEVHDTPQAKLCPECGRILIRFRVGHGMDFRLDHCNACNGVWFDKNEWEMLESRNLHDEIHKIFTTQWQNEIRADEKNRYFNEMYVQKFGEDFMKIREFKLWLDNHELKQTILAFLSDPRPFE